MATRDQIIALLAATPGLTLSNSSAPAQPSAKPTPQPVTATPKTIGGFVKNIGTSALNNVSNIAQAVVHPITTLQGLTNAAAGGLRYLVPDTIEQKLMGGTAATNATAAKQKEIADALGQFYKERYGSTNAIGNTLYKDPVGAGLDLATIFGGASGIAKGIAGVGEAAGATNAAETASRLGANLSKAADIVDPIRQGLNLVSKGASLVPNAGKAAPFARSVDTGLLDTAKQAGITLPASAVSKSPAVGLVETLGGKGILGHEVVNRFDKAVSALDDYAQRIAGNTTQGEAGRSVIDAIKKYKEDFIKTKNDLYDQAVLPPKNAKGTAKLIVTPTESLSTVKELLDSAKNSLVSNGPITSFYKTLVKKLSKSKLNAIEMRQTIVDLNKKLSNPTDLVATGDKAALAKVVNALKNDLDNGIKVQRPDLAEVLDKANSFYKTNIDRLNSSYGKAIQSNINSPEKILDVIVKTDSADSLPQIYSMIGPEATAKVQSALINDIVGKARSAVTDRISGASITNAIKRYGEATIKAALTPEQYEGLTKVSDLADALAKSAKVAEGSQTAFTGRMLGEVALLFGNPILGIKALLGDAAFSKWIGSPAGQRFLTTGVQVLPSAEQIGNLARKTAPLRPAASLSQGINGLSTTPNASATPQSTFVDQVKKAQAAGADSTQLLQAIIQQNSGKPISAEIQRALSDGVDPNAILQGIISQNSAQSVPS